MLRADQLIVVHHDDTTREFTNVTYALGRDGLRVVNADGTEQTFPQHDILTIHACLAHPSARRESRGWLAATA